MSRKAFPLMLKTVNLPTASAEGNTRRISIRLLHRALLAMRYQASRGPASSECTLAACKSFLRLMTCKSGLTNHWIRNLRICQDKVRDLRFGQEWGLECLRDVTCGAKHTMKRASGGTPWKKPIRNTRLIRCDQEGC